MRKIIKNKVYDTDKSERICHVPGNQNEAKTLYKKKGTISFFTVVDRWNIVQPVTWNEAKEMIRQYGTREQYNKYFTFHNPYGVPLKKQRTNMDMDKETYAIIRTLAGEHGMSVKGYHRKVFHDLYRRYAKKNNLPSI